MGFRDSVVLLPKERFFNSNGKINGYLVALSNLEYFLRHF